MNQNDVVTVAKIATKILGYAAAEQFASAFNRPGRRGIERGISLYGRILLGSVLGDVFAEHANAKIDLGVEWYNNQKATSED